MSVDQKETIKENEEAIDQQEKSSTEEVLGAPPTKRERRQDRKQHGQQSREARLGERANAAPEGLFKRTTKSEVVAENPEALALFKEQVTQYSTVVVRGGGEGTEIQQATKTFHSAIRKLTTLKGETLVEAFKFLYETIESNKRGSFATPLPFRWAHSISGEEGRIAYTSFMNLMLQYVKLDDPTAIHERVDVARSLAFIKDKQQLSKVTKLFATK